MEPIAIQSAQETTLRIVLLLTVFALWIAEPTAAQDADSVRSRLRLTLEELATPPAIGHPLFTHDARRKIGPLTLVPPTYPGEMVRFSFPIGDFVVRGARALRSAEHRRAERKAKADVQRAILEWEAQQRR